MMNISRLVFIIISIVVIIKVYMVKSLDEASVISFAVLVSASMVWFTDLWVVFMRFGFMESMARDSRTPQNSTAGIIALGWIILLVIAGCVFFL
jgi:glucan phosphoethanolaminetransferase (alkaline phosphatase superfamily)